MYATGRGVPRDDHEAVTWYRRAAEQGLAEGEINLGRMYDTGAGVPQDDQAAVKWSRSAAEHGLAEAQNNLGRMYYLGQGVPQDYVLAHMWANLGASNGNKNAIKGRNMVEKKMSKQQITQAQEMARNWKPNKRTTYKHGLEVQ